MNIKTKKYQLTNQTFISIALKNVMLDLWWVWLIPVAILLIPIFYIPAFWWCFTIALVLSVLYVLFWVIQFTGITQMEQSKILFEKLSYEINSKHILIMLNAREGMPIAWNQIKKVKKGKDHFLFIISKGQFIHLPYKIFKSDNEIKFVDTILKRKNFLQ